MQHLNITYKQNDNIKLILKNTCSANPSKNWLQAYYFQIQNLKGEIIGRCDLRLGNNKRIYYGGNIGYYIEENHRNKHYASEAVTMLLTLAKKCKLSYVIISTAPENNASRRVCENVGAELIEIAELPIKHEFRIQKGQTKVCIYKVNL